MELVQEQEDEQPEMESHPDIEQKLRDIEDSQVEKRSLFDKEREKHKKPAIKMSALNMPDAAGENRLKTAAYIAAFLAVAIPLWLMVYAWL